MGEEESDNVVAHPIILIEVASVSSFEMTALQQYVDG